MSGRRSHRRAYARHVRYRHYHFVYYFFFVLPPRGDIFESRAFRVSASPVCRFYFVHSFVKYLSNDSARPPTEREFSNCEKQKKIKEWDSEERETERRRDDARERIERRRERPAGPIAKVQPVRFAVRLSERANKIIGDVRVGFL